MKYVILLALVALAASQNHRPNFDHNNPLDHLIHAEVMEILSKNPDITVDHCQTKCDALFDLDAGHDEQITDDLCRQECAHQLHARPT
ncbi:uncharacterized protein LOC143302010 [Babylonia areolata]|uniref:uncharacterized protein LOC143302010 n=1 Tax=Babylonia areolata TaxID=304850 RepID=UPI003FD1A141